MEKYDRDVEAKQHELDVLKVRSIFTLLFFIVYLCYHYSINIECLNTKCLNCRADVVLPDFYRSLC
jgi:hypothetical protein